MAKVEFTRVETDEEVEDISIKDGQLIYSKSGKTYMDYGDERIPTGSGGGSVNVDTEMSDISENAVQNKVIKEYVDNEINDTKDLIPNLSNQYGTSDENGYTQEYINTAKQDALTSTDWISLGNTVYYKKYGNIVTVTGLSLGNFSIGDYTTVATLPAGARPTQVLSGTWALSISGPVRIYPTGEIQLYAANSTSYWSFSITFII